MKASDTPEVMSSVIRCSNAQVIHISERSSWRNEQLFSFIKWTKDIAIPIA
jgi:hypothetical protein